MLLRNTFIFLMRQGIQLEFGSFAFCARRQFQHLLFIIPFHYLSYKGLLCIYGLTPSQTQQTAATNIGSGSCSGMASSKQVNGHSRDDKNVDWRTFKKTERIFTEVYLEVFECASMKLMHPDILKKAHQDNHKQNQQHAN
ncbi:hypothetical protein [Paenibacillus dendrobii]|uniref:hypothetical protein n=1 Tax=Paenibacillus dendrobii TaxID=2691084 RepID=UPI001F3AA2CE|nr:hypothetical protein [Paenibacillus dendrobii]